MTLLLAIALALFLLPSPWGAIAVAAAAIWEIGQLAFGLWYQRKPALAGVETLRGEPGVAITRCAPTGQVKVHGEIWRARCDEGVEAGETVEVRAVDGLTLVVRPAPSLSDPSGPGASVRRSGDRAARLDQVAEAAGKGAPHLPGR